MDYVNALKGKLIVTLFKGELHIKIKYQDKQKNWTIKGELLTQQLEYDLTDQVKNYDWTAINVEIVSGDTRSIYSLNLQRDNNT